LLCCWSCQADRFLKDQGIYVTCFRSRTSSWIAAVLCAQQTGSPEASSVHRHRSPGRSPATPRLPDPIGDKQRLTGEEVWGRARLAHARTPSGLTRVLGAPALATVGRPIGLPSRRACRSPQHRDSLGSGVARLAPDVGSFSAVLLQFRFAFF
jgi:hypothetical protein